MIIISPTGALPASSNANVAAASSQWPFGKLLLRAIVILIGIAVGLVVGVIIGFVTGWIEIPIC